MGSGTMSREMEFVPSEHLLIDRAQLLTLTAPEMTVLIGGLRVLGQRWRCEARCATDRLGTLSNDFFIDLLDMGTEWAPFPKSVMCSKDVIVAPVC